MKIKSSTTNIVVQEYAAPKNIDENKARQRLLDAVTATLQVTGIETNKLILKVRQKQKGMNQYEKLANKGEYFYVNEYGAQLCVRMKTLIMWGGISTNVLKAKDSLVKRQPTIQPAALSAAARKVARLLMPNPTMRGLRSPSASMRRK